MSDSLASFESSLQGVLKKKPPISASTTSELTKTASSQPLENVPKLALKIENFISSSPSSYKLSGFYLIDSICKTKSEVRKAYIENFAPRLASHIAGFLQDASDKDEESIKKLARIWLEKHIFNDSTMSQVAQVLRDSLQYTIPGSESLPPPPTPVVPIQSMSLAPAPSAAPPGQSWPYPPSYPPQGSGVPPNTMNGYPPGAPGSYLPPPAPYQPPTGIGTGSSLTDDLSKLGDLSALLGGSMTGPPIVPMRPQNDFLPQPPLDSRYAPHEQHFLPNDGRMVSDPRFPGDNRSSMSDSRYNRDHFEQHPYPPSQPPYRDSRQNGHQRDGGDYQNRNQSPFGQSSAPREGFSGPTEETGPIYSSTLFIGSLPNGATESDMRQMFGPFGRIKRVTMKADRGIAFVAFIRRVDAELAKSTQDGANFGGRSLKIRWAKSDQHYHGTVDPETGLMSFDNDGTTPPSHKASAPHHPAQHGIPRGLKPQTGSSFADDNAIPSYNQGYSGGSRTPQDPRSSPPQSRYSQGGRDDENRGKRRFEGDHPSAEKRRFDSGGDDDQGFQSVTSWSGS